MNEEEKTTRRIPILDLPQLTDDHWNQLAYQNWLERRFRDLPNDMRRKDFSKPVGVV